MTLLGFHSGTTGVLSRTFGWRPARGKDGGGWPGCREVVLLNGRGRSWALKPALQSGDSANFLFSLPMISRGGFPAESVRAR